jgi:molybdenum cofactor cytidylyltransferase
MIAALVLAAGRSRRMGVQKLLLPLGGQPVIARIVDKVLRSPVDKVLVVVRQGDESVARALGGRKVRFVANPHAEGEMLSSVRCGLLAVPAEADGVLIVLGDQPGISREVVAELVRTFQAGSRGIVVPTCGGQRGHPLLVATRYRDEILSRYDDTGLRGLLRAYPEDVWEVEVSTPKIFDDMDTPEDYRRMAALDY